MMHALVTGGGGFLGRYIVEQLIARGDRVRCFGRGEYPEIESLGAEVVRGDVRDSAAVSSAIEGVDAVFHTAAIAGIWGAWDDFYQVNTVGTQHVISGCHEHEVKKLIFTSSPSVTFSGTDQCGVDESAPYPNRWLAHYPHTKALAEQAVLSSNGVRGLATCALRPHLIWGPRDSHLIPRLVDRARSGQLRRVGDGTNLVDTVYVENAAAAHLQAANRLSLESPVAGRAYFISQGEPVNCWEWIDQILDLAGLPPLQRRISATAAYHVGSAMELIYWLCGRTDEPRMSRFLARQLATSHYFDISAARRELDYEPKIGQLEGMQKLAKWLEQSA